MGVGKQSTFLPLSENSGIHLPAFTSYLCHLLLFNAVTNYSTSYLNYNFLICKMGILIGLLDYCADFMR